MLVISKAQLYLARALFWGGLACALFGGLGASDLGFLMVGTAFGLLGARLLDKLYTCPNCGYKLLKANGMSISFRENCPDRCPSCRTPITIEKK